MCHDGVMADLGLLLKAWDTAHWELGEAFEGLPDEDVWKRPHPWLLSVGEIAAHVAYVESAHVTGDATASPLLSSEARYYTVTLESPLDLGLSAQEVYQEVERIHGLAKAVFLEKDGEEINPLRDEWTWGETLEHMVFHVAYHTGQIYSVRHLLGHATVDN